MPHPGARSRRLLDLRLGYIFQTIHSMPSDVSSMEQSTGSEWSSVVCGKAKKLDEQPARRCLETVRVAKNILTGLYYGSFRAECLCYAPKFDPSRGGAIGQDWRFLTRIRVVVGSLQCPLSPRSHRSSIVLRAWLAALTGHTSAAVLMVLIAGVLEADRGAETSIASNSYADCLRNECKGLLQCVG